MFMIQVKIPGLIIQELGLGDKEKLRFILGEKSWPEYKKYWPIEIWLVQQVSHLSWVCNFKLT